MHVAICVQEHVVRLYISVDDALAMHIAQGAAKFRYPKANCFLCKRFSRYVKTKVTAAHEIDDEIPGTSVSDVSVQCVAQGFGVPDARDQTHMYSMSWKL